MVVRQYRADGPLVRTLLPVVAMDDAVGIIVFGISTSIAQTIISPVGDFSIMRVILQPTSEILISLFAGFAIGLGLSYVSRKAKGENDLLSITIASIFIAIGIAEALQVSTLLCCMMVGATVSNMAYNSQRVLSVVDRFTPPVFITFFALAGVDLKLSVLRQVGLIGMGYIVFRVIGKLVGAGMGARITGAPEVVRKYLGLTLIPQAGVAIGLSMLAESMFPEMGSVVKTIILSATVIYELIGPVVSKTALQMAGEIKSRG